MTSGHNLRRAAISTGPVGLLAAGVGAAARTSDGFDVGDGESCGGGTTWSVGATCAAGETWETKAISDGCASTVGVAMVAMLPRRSILSIREIRPISEESGKSMRPQMSSSINRGAVAPRICVNPSATISAARIKLAVPIRLAWDRIRCN